MRQTIATDRGPVDIAADDPSVQAGMVRVTLGQGLLSVTVFLTPPQVEKIAGALQLAAGVA